ncbi:TonB-dependent receptor plug domain-containing protein [Taibaiella lutea]|uniref:TonB-dependent receptor plug domain-containing protein n=1 Tax=Taibaiella lutea TaxID=2608001 RepID=A0A5M6CDG7_9BACT|nr:TonB-dependent receptor [Taibaiella lutea]KAA5533228.1 TonB-dependent receptor plug domain-containing protein [Taibaiella lutea]
MSLRFTLLLILNITALNGYAQTRFKGRITDTTNHNAVADISIRLNVIDSIFITDAQGRFNILTSLDYDSCVAIISKEGYNTITQMLYKDRENEVMLSRSLLEEVVITGNSSPVKRSSSAIPTELYTPSFFLKNPTPSLFDAMSMVTGVRPQLNCNVCNTGDIHINGMEGPYTLILIDGMPVVSALSTVYGLSGIPNSLVERIEIVKGPTAAMYGSEAMGGMINVITRNPQKTPFIHLDIMTTTWAEVNTDVTSKFKINNKIQSLLGINYFNYQQPKDNNKDGFTDMTLQNRISIFNKWSFLRNEDRIASIAARYVYEDRWGGQMNWDKQWRGSDSIYGESIYTNRWEVLGLYQLPVNEKIISQFSVIGHNQDSYYGKTSFQGNQKVAFGQIYWEKNLRQHKATIGTSLRYTYYNDNTPATANEAGRDKPNSTALTGLFIQDEWHFASKHDLYLGYRLDYDPILKGIHSPRLAYKWSPDNSNTFRASFGKGFRVVNIFTEDHAALTGARKVEIAEALAPEKSYNSNLNYSHTTFIGGGFVNIDVLAFYSLFTNKIIGDFDTDPDKIIYKNIDGRAISRGLTINTDATFSIPLNVRIGVNYMDVYQKNKDNIKTEQLFAPKWSGNFSFSYTLPKQIVIDLSGQINGPMRLPIQRNDYRPEYSPVFCLANIQFSKKIDTKWEVYAGIKNILNFVPKDTYMRPFDPFDKHVNDAVNNPNGYTFDTEYNYAPLQGIRGFAGLRYTLK